MSSDDFMIKVQSSTRNNQVMQCTAEIKYIGDDQNLSDRLNDESALAKVHISFHVDKMTLRLAGYERDYSTRDRKRKIRLPSSTYQGFLHSFYNYASMYQLYNEFPILNKLKGVTYVLLLCCICEALKLGFITLESEIVLEASGSIPGQSMHNLVSYYQQMGFSPIFREYLDIGVEQQYVPMKAQVQRIISLCTVNHVAPEMLELLPVRMCKGMCGL